MRRINVRVNDSLKMRLEAEAHARGVRPSDIVRRALEEHLGETPPPKNALQLAKELGLIGCFKGLPADLSTNPKHMEGFGE